MNHIAQKYEKILKIIQFEYLKKNCVVLDHDIDHERNCYLNNWTGSVNFNSPRRTVTKFCK